MPAQNIHERLSRLSRPVVYLVALVLVAIVTTLMFSFWQGGGGEQLPSEITQESTVASILPEPSAPSDSQLTIVAFGDSITAGYGITVSEAYPQALENALRAKGYDVRVINSGVSGETTAGGLRRAEFVAAQKPHVVIIALGGNDVLRGITPASSKENLRGIIKIFKQAGIRILLAGMRAPNNLGPEYVQEFDAMYPALAKEYGLRLAPFLLDGVALDPIFNQNDGLHPNPVGAKIIAEKNILPELLPLL